MEDPPTIYTIYLAASYRLGDGTKTDATLATSPSHASGANVLSLTHACLQYTHVHRPCGHAVQM